MNILLIAPQFYGFDREIANKLQDASQRCALFAEKPAYRLDIIQLLVQKFPPLLYTWFFNRHVSSILRTSADAEIVLIIRGEHWKTENLFLMRNRFPSAKFILYEWDTSENLPNLGEQLSFFDDIYTFNPDDAVKFGLKEKPLFYKANWRDAKSSTVNLTNQYKVAFIGTDHTDRYQFIQKFKALNQIGDHEFFCHLYRSRWSFYYNKYIKSGSRLGSRKYDFQPLPLGESDSINIFLAARSILDINPAGQVGLSARTFEALALNKKLITTNKNIAKYDFFNPNNICIIDRLNPVVPQEFFESEYVNPQEEIVQKYASLNWVKEFLH